MNPNSFVFLSEILGLPCVDAATGRRIGKLSDLSAHFREAYPRVTGLVVKTGFSKQRLLRWDSIRSIDIAKRKILLRLDSYELLPPEPVSEDEVLIRDVFYDKQIINVSGSKVVRVNDLHILCDGAKMWIVHFDVGFSGILRRLGLAGAVGRFADFFFSYTFKDTFIRWRDSQLAMEANAYGEFELKIPVNRLSEMHPADLADILAELGIEDRMMIFGSLDPASAAATLQEVSKNIRIQIAEQLEPPHLGGIIHAMQKDEAADLIEHLTRETKNALFRQLPHETVGELVELMNYSVKSAGSIMNTDFAAVRGNLSVAQVLDTVRSDFCSIESLHYLYITGGSGSLDGVISLKDLLCSDSAAAVSSAMKKNIIKVEVDTPLDEVAHLFFKYNFPVIPVVSEENILEGVITLKDALEAVYPKMVKEIEG